MKERRCPHGFYRSMIGCAECGPVKRNRKVRHVPKPSLPAEIDRFPTHTTAPREIGYDQHGEPVYR